MQELSDSARRQIINQIAKCELLFELVQAQEDFLHRREDFRVVTLDIQRDLGPMADVDREFPQSFKERNLFPTHNSHLCRRRQIPIFTSIRGYLILTNLPTKPKTI